MAYSEQHLKRVKAYADNLARMARYISVEEARALVAELERVDTLMPFVDPTGYLSIRDNLPGHQRLARAVLAFLTELEAALAEVDGVATAGRAG